MRSNARWHHPLQCLLSVCNALAAPVIHSAPPLCRALMAPLRSTPAPLDEQHIPAARALTAASTKSSCYIRSRSRLSGVDAHTRCVMNFSIWQVFCWMTLPVYANLVALPLFCYDDGFHELGGKGWGYSWGRHKDK